MSKTLELLKSELNSTSSQASLTDELKGRIIESENELKLLQESHSTELNEHKARLSEAEHKFK